MRLAARTLCALIVAWLSGCQDDPTQTLVYVHADPGLASGATMLRITVLGEDEVVEERTDPVDRSRAQLARLPLVPRGGAADRTWEVFAELLEGDEVRATLRVAGGYVANETREIRAWFDPEGCAEECGEGRTCSGGRCVGACYVGRARVDEEVSSTRDRPACGECEICGRGQCQPREGECSCGGTCDDGTCRPALGADEVFTGEHVTCAAAGGLWCWGHNWAERVGIPRNTHSDVPVRMNDELSNLDETFRGIRDMAMGADHSCLLWTRPGPEFVRSCWGWNGGGALGIGEVENGSLPPTEITADEPTWLLLSAGRFYTCGLGEDGRAYCWGSSNRGQLGASIAVGEASGTPVAIDDRNGWTHLDAGTESVCGVIEGRVECWGAGRSGERGDGSREDSTTPSCVVNDDDQCLQGFDEVSVGGGAACAIDLESRAWCWGSNEDGKLGVEGSEFVTRPRRVQTELRFRELHTTGGHTCAIDLDDGLWCWGRNRDSSGRYGGGFLGTGDLDSRTRPTRVEVSADDRWRHVAVGSGYACGIRQAGDLYCWGSNDWSATADQPAAGRLGLGLGTNTDDDPAAGADVLQPRQVCFD